MENLNILKNDKAILLKLPEIVLQLLNQYCKDKKAVRNKVILDLINKMLVEYEFGGTNE